MVESRALDLQVLLRAHEVGDELLVVTGRDGAVLRAHAQLVDRLDVGVGQQRGGILRALVELGAASGDEPAQLLVLGFSC